MEQPNTFLAAAQSSPIYRRKLNELLRSATILFWRRGLNFFLLYKDRFLLNELSAVILFASQNPKTQCKGFRYEPFDAENPKSYQNRFSNPKRYDDSSPRFLCMVVPTRIYVPLIKLSQILHEHVYIAIKLKNTLKHFIKKSRHVIIKKAAEVK